MAAANAMSQGVHVPGFFSGFLSFFCSASGFPFFSFGFFVSGAFISGVVLSAFKSSAETETLAQARTSAAAHAVFLMTFHPPWSDLPNLGWSALTVETARPSLDVAIRRGNAH